MCDVYADGLVKSENWLINESNFSKLLFVSIRSDASSGDFVVVYNGGRI